MSDCAKNLVIKLKLINWAALTTRCVELDWLPKGAIIPNMVSIVKMMNLSLHKKRREKRENKNSHRSISSSCYWIKLKSNGGTTWREWNSACWIWKLYFLSAFLSHNGRQRHYVESIIFSKDKIRNALRSLGGFKKISFNLALKEALEVHHPSLPPAQTSVCHCLTSGRMVMSWDKIKKTFFE